MGATLVPDLTFDIPMLSRFPIQSHVVSALRRLLCLAVMVLPVHFAPAQTVAQVESLQEQGVKEFFAGHIKESVALWDRYLEKHPEQGPYHWQRGIALYYAEKFAEGRAQFESHVKVNPQDVENSVWHFLCVARQENVAAARQALLPVDQDLRVPMREVLNLFAEKGTTAEVLAAAEAVPEGRRRDALCFAHLYLGLYEEALGHAESAKAHLVKSAVDYAMPHYMGQVARVHCELRGWLPVKKAVEVEKKGE